MGNPQQGYPRRRDCRDAPMQKPDVTVMRAEYPNAEQQTSTQQMKRPFDKTSANVEGTSLHPHSQNKPNQRMYRMDGS